MARFFSPQTDPHLFRCPCNRPECDAPQPTEELLATLDLVRSIVNRPLIVTSGTRCEPYNTSIGGELDSEHLLGQAVDIWTPTAAQTFSLVFGAERGGVTRIGAYLDRHVHLDVSRTKPQNVLWVK